MAIKRYQIFLDGVKQPDQDLDTAQPLAAQLQDKLQITGQIYIADSLNAPPSTYDPLGPNRTLGRIVTEPQGLLYLYTSIREPQQGIPRWLIAIASALVVLGLVGGGWWLWHTNTQQQIAQATAQAATAQTTTAIAAAKTQSATGPAQPPTTTTVATTETATASPGPPTATPTVIPLPTQRPRNDNPCGTAEYTPTVRIAIAAPLTGPDSDKGEAMVNAACLALQNVQTDLPAGLSIQLSAFDDQNDPGRGVAVANEIVADPSISCVVGHRSSDVSIDALEVYTPTSQLMISPSNSNPEVRTKGGLVLAGNDIGQAAAGVFFITDTLDLATDDLLLVLHDDSTYADTLLSEIEGRWQAGSASFVDFSEGTPNVDSLIATVQNLTNTDFKAIYITARKVDDVIAIIAALRKAGITAPIVVSDASDSPKLFDQGFQDVYVTTMAMPNDQLAEFGADYLNRFGGQLPDIPAYTAEAYDATLMCLRAIQRAAQNSGATTRERVHEIWMANPSVNQGYPNRTITGPYNYDAERNFIDGGTYFVRNSTGARVGKYKCAEVTGGACREAD